MNVSKVITNRDSMIVRNEFVWKDLVGHIKQAIENSKFKREATYSFVDGFIMLSTLASFRRGNMEWNDTRQMCVGIINDQTKELKLMSLFDLMPELKDLYDE